MTTFGIASKGVSWLLGAQVVVGIGQFLYSGVTARIFAPSEFGTFAAALSLQALLVLLMTTGIPAIILRDKHLSRTDIIWIRVYSLIGGSIAATAFMLISPYWLDTLRASQGADYVPLFTVAIFIGPFAAVESTLLRKEGRPIADSVTIVLAFALPAALVLCAAISGLGPWVLALATAASPMVLLVCAALARKARYHSGGLPKHKEHLKFGYFVSAQNVVFFLIAQAPIWTVASVLGASSLGQYSRASTLTGLPSFALATAMNRSVQQHWNKLQSRESIAQAMKDTLGLVAGLILPLFAIVAALGSDLTVLWIGPGWELAGSIVPWLAIAYGIQVPFTVLANSLEMRGLFRPVRVSQIGSIVALAVGITILAFSNELWLAAATVLLSQMTGMITLLISMSRVNFVAARSLLFTFATCVGWAAFVGSIAFLSAGLSKLAGWAIFGMPELSSVLIGGAAGVLAWVATFGLQKPASVLARRGVRLPGLISFRE